MSCEIQWVMGFNQMFIVIISYPLVFISVIWVIDIDKDPNKQGNGIYQCVFCEFTGFKNTLWL